MHTLHHTTTTHCNILQQHTTTHCNTPASYKHGPSNLPPRAAATNDPQTTPRARGRTAETRLPEEGGGVLQASRGGRDIGLFCRDVGLFCGNRGVLCRDAGLLCESVGPFWAQKRQPFGPKRDKTDATRLPVLPQSPIYTQKGPLYTFFFGGSVGKYRQSRLCCLTTGPH